MPRLSSLISNQIRFLLQSLNDSNSDSVFRELCQFIEYGSEGSFLVLHTCLDHINFDGRVIHIMKLKPDFMATIFRFLLGRPNFSTVFCEAFRSIVAIEGFLGEFCNALHLSMSEKIGLGLALADSENLDIRTSGQNFCMRQIEESCGNSASLGSAEQIQNIVMFLYRTEGLTQHVDSFMQMLSLMELKEATPFILAPLLSDDLCEASFPRNLDLFYDCRENDFDVILAEMESETSMADIMRELGYGCTINATRCKEVLSLFLPLTEVTVSRIISTIARTHSGLDDNQVLYPTFCSAIGSSTTSDTLGLSSWDINVLVDSIQQLAPGTNWILVMENLDHDSFYFPNEEAFSFFMSIYLRACKDAFPLHAICGSVWKNVDGQLSFLRYAVSAPADMFTFAHSTRQLAYADALTRHELPHEHENKAWLSLELLEVLCQLAERGHVNSVRQMLQFPLMHCPTMLLLGMAQINTAYNLIQCEVCSTVFPMIAVKSLGSAVILQLWHLNPPLVLRAFIDMIRTDKGNMARILDICQEVKILSSLLDQIPFAFSIRLAALSSQKEFLNLEKWLNHNLSTYKNVFFEECLKFVKEVPVVAADNVLANSFQHSGALLNLYADTSATFLKVLQDYSEQIASKQLFEELKELRRASKQVSPRLQNVGDSDLSTSDDVNDIEAEANFYFHQIFSGPSTVELMIPMLVSFKDSSDKRERLIFECMIQNLFEEYQFFPKYPEKQLTIAAVLLGSLVKHQLLTHVTLGFALRGVLDALRKPTESRLFAFGIRSLKLFLDRLAEWPQYCYHILQISHLRGAHPELVGFVERVLARTSKSQLEANIGNSAAAADPQASATSATLENLEVSDSSLQILGLRTAQPEQQLSSPLQTAQRYQGFLGDRHKTSGNPSYNAKPLLPPFRQHSNASISDAANSQKSLQTAFSQTATSGPATWSSSLGFIHPPRAITSTSMLRPHSYNTGFGSALNIETLVAAAERRDTPIEAPASDIKDKMLFLINNISSSNLEAKAKEFTELLNEQYYPWFAQYMVMKRTSIEPNFHDLYLMFLEKVNSKELNKQIVKAAYENCKVLLRSELIKSSSEERSLLKNLGSWLGKFTIGRNQVLRAREIDPKSLIIGAYEKGLMIAVIPFTSKILEPCQSSLAYRPPNPWTMAVLSLLVEIYALPNLKMNLKFDIEVLFKNLGVDMKELKPTSLLKARVREVEGNPDFSNKDIGASHPQMVAEMNPAIMPTLNQVELQPDTVGSTHLGSHVNALSQYPAGLHLASGPLNEDEKMTTLNLSDRLSSGQGLSQMIQSQSPYSGGQLPAPKLNIGSHIIFNPKLSQLSLHCFQRVFPAAMERAIKEVMSPVVQRSVAIAIQTTKELVLKDYALESDETRIYNASHLMVASLAGSLAHVTCKEPLRGSISSQLRNSFRSLNIANELFEQDVPLVMNDNLDLGCVVIENAATDKALQTIDVEIAQQLSLRRKHREGVGASYYDASMYTQGPMGVIPEALRPRPGHLSHSQQRVYEGFVRVPWQNQSGQSSNAGPAGLPASSSGSANSGLSRAYGSSAQLNSGFYSSGFGSTGLSMITQPLDLITEEMNPSSAQFYSGSSTRIGSVDGVTPHGVQHSSVALFPSPAAGSELHSVEASCTVKELGSTAVSLSVTSTTEQMGSGISEPLFNTKDAMEKYQIVAQKLETLISKDTGEAEIQGVIAQIPEILLKCISRDEAALAVAQKVFKSLYENASNSLHVGAHLAILAAIRDVCKLVVKEVTNWVIYSDEDRKFNTDIIVGLIRKDLLNLAEYNMHMAKLIDAGRNKAATEFSISLLQTLLVQDLRVSVSELPNLVDVLAKVVTRSGSPEGLQQLIEIARNPAANAAILSGFSLGNEDGDSQSREKKASDRSTMSREDFDSSESVAVDPAGFRDQVALLFGDWCHIYELHVHGTNDTASTQFISQLQQNGFLNGDDMTERFFHLLMELSVAHCLSSEGISTGSVPFQSPQQAKNIFFFAIDVYAKLVVLILKYCIMEPRQNKLFLLPKILSVIVRVIQRDAEEKKASFNPRPYFRLFINWLFDIVSSEPVLDGTHFQFQVLITFANAFHALQPLKIPAFSFAWLELVSHRSFMPKLLTVDPPNGWIYIQRLLVALFKFMEPYLRSAELGEPIHILYRGTLRVLLVLLHDFPEFLCDYHFSFCNVIPSSCIQMRNVILSAFPRNMRLPDPNNTPNLKIDLLPEINQSPRIFSEVDAALKSKQVKSCIDEYLKTRHQPSSFLSELKQRLLLPQNEAVQICTQYNIPLVNSLVLYVGMETIQQLQTKTQSLAQQMTHNGPMESNLLGAATDIYQTLITDLDTEGRYIYLNAIANQLRYPNNHTYFFSYVLLYLFVEANQEIIQEQITRVLLERLIVSRPHPWGLLITFIELIKNPRYNFWSRSFTRCEPAIEKLFDSVSRSFGSPKHVDDSVVSAGFPDMH